MTVFLHPRHRHDGYIVSDVQTVGSGIEAYVKLNFLLSQHFVQIFVVNGLFDKASFFKHVVYVFHYIFLLETELSVIFIISRFRIGF